MGKDNAKVIKIDDRHFKNIVTSSSIPVVICHWAKYCCLSSNLLRTLDELAVEFTDKVKFVKTEMMKNSFLYILHSVIRTPTLIMFKNGKRVSTLTGENSKVKVTEWINQHIGE